MTDRDNSRRVSWSAGRAGKSRPSAKRRPDRRAGATDVPLPDQPARPSVAAKDAKTPGEAAPKPEFDLASLPSLEFDHRGHRHPRLPRPGRADGTRPCGPSPRVVGRSGDPRLQRTRRERLGLHRSDRDAGVRPAAGGHRHHEAGGADFRRGRKADRRRRRRRQPADPQPPISRQKSLAPNSQADVVIARRRAQNPIRQKHDSERAHRLRKAILCSATIILHRTTVFPVMTPEEPKQPPPAWRRIASVESSTHSLRLLTRCLVGRYLYIEIISNRGLRMRDPGPEEAIRAVGGVSELARHIGISQPSVSNWNRVPAERVLIVEAATGVDRKVPAARSLSRARQDQPAPDDVAAARAQEYALLATLLARAPDAKLLASLARLARRRDAARCRACRAGAGRQRNHGRARRARVSSISSSGSAAANCCPTARTISPASCTSVRWRGCAAISAPLGIERAEGNYEPEDHAATLCEIMAGLVERRPAGAAGHRSADFREASGALDRALLRRSGAGRSRQSLSPNRHARPGVHGNRNGSVCAAVMRRRVNGLQGGNAMKEQDKTQNKTRSPVVTSFARSAPAPVSRRPPQRRSPTRGQGRQREQR